MKKLLLLIPLLSVMSIAQAADGDICAEVMSYGISPAGVCESFNNSCIPADYRRVPSCEAVQNDNDFSSLEDRLRARFHGKTRITNSNKVKSVSGKYKRVGRGFLTRRALRENTSSDNNEDAVGVDRTSTVKNFRSKYRQHNLRGGFDRDQKSTGHTNAYKRPSVRTRSTEDKNTDQKFTTDAKWSSAVKDHFRQKNYGTNPYSLASKRSAQQRAYRAKKADNAQVDVKGRIISRSRRWRPGRLDGNLSGDASFLESEAEKKSDVIESLDD